MTVPSTQFVQIEKPVYGGDFLARLEGKAVFVPLALPGEQVRVRMLDEKRGYATAEVEEIVIAAPERIAPACHTSELAEAATISTLTMGCSSS
jgi:23S rRNA (uracil1939-C5)-methyltransferase